jgi:hypothetical protein
MIGIDLFDFADDLRLAETHEKIGRVRPSWNAFAGNPVCRAEFLKQLSESVIEGPHLRE